MFTRLFWVYASEKININVRTPHQRRSIITTCPRKTKEINFYTDFEIHTLMLKFIENNISKMIS